MTKIKLLLFAFWCFTNTTILLSQTPEVCIDCDATPRASLKIHSVAQGVIVPKMTSLERLAILNPTTGTLIFDTTNNNFWLFDGNTWVAMSTVTASQRVVQGPRGPQGIQGPRGPQGKTGPRGVQGIQGVQGPKGTKGRTGARGPQGYNGPKGNRGAVGARGPRGYTGTTGAKGDTGARGPQGVQGLTGPRGAQGLRGPQGPQGHQGPMGLQGFQGLRGSQGARGPQGPRGVQGPQGISIKGEPGPRGPVGPAGPCCSSSLAEELEELARLKAVFEEQATLVTAQKAQIEEMDIRLNHLVEMLAQALKSPAVITDVQKEISAPVVVTANLVLEEQAALAQNYPNPFQKSTNIEYYIPSTTKEAVMRITNIEGQQIGMVQLEETGHGLVTIDANTYASGTFFYTLILDGEVSDTKKMILRE